MEPKKATLPREMTIALEKLLVQEGYILPGYVEPAIDQDTTVHCPLCGEVLHVYCAGNSYEITCPIHKRIVTARGI